ncbi:CHASE3 domain protein [Moorella thermoacetica]|uniref:CHASE3 domain protein n=1 Tax=Neomoorella thermoacetica TaxID=1525 RepID=A0A1J5JNM7_NEOTH|nr:CHASE3 domain-containing protein [Moorella thermoacetica]OIQ08315.1 CHASE3 domain protein [Moorella thermoacetica]
MQKYFNSRLPAITIALFIMGVIGQTIWLYKHMVELAGEYYQAARDSYVALYDLERIEKLAIDMETGLRGYLLTGDPAFLKPYNEARQEMQGYYEKLYEILGPDAASLASLESINYEIQNWISTFAEPSIARRKLLGQDTTLKNLTAGIDLSRSKTIMDHIRNDFDRADKNHEVYRSKQIQDILALHRRLTFQSLGGTGVLLLVIF